MQHGRTAQNLIRHLPAERFIRQAGLTDSRRMNCKAKAFLLLLCLPDVPIVSGFWQARLSSLNVGEQAGLPDESARGGVGGPSLQLVVWMIIVINIEMK